MWHCWDRMVAGSTLTADHQLLLTTRSSVLDQCQCPMLCYVVQSPRNLTSICDAISSLLPFITSDLDNLGEDSATFTQELQSSGCDCCPLAQH